MAAIISNPSKHGDKSKDTKLNWADAVDTDDEFDAEDSQSTQPQQSTPLKQSTPPHQSTQPKQAIQKHRMTSGDLKELVETSMETISFRDKDFTVDDGNIAVFFEQFKHHTTLTNLDFSHTQMDDKCVIALAQKLQAFFRSNEESQLEARLKVQRLNLGSNKITDMGAGALSVVIANPYCTLRSVDLSNNEIGRVGVSSILSALEYNKTMSVINLNGNPEVDMDMLEVLSRKLQPALEMELKAKQDALRFTAPCKHFTTNVCTKNDCKLPHFCQLCGSKGHGAVVCPKLEGRPIPLCEDFIQKKGCNLEKYFSKKCNLTHCFSCRTKGRNNCTNVDCVKRESIKRQRDMQSSESGNPVSIKDEAVSRHSGILCEERFLCSKGLSCEYAHSPAERDVFQRNKGVGVARVNLKLCNNGENCRQRNRTCKFAHSEQELVCFKCLAVGDHASEVCVKYKEINKQANLAQAKLERARQVQAQNDRRSEEAKDRQEFSDILKQIEEGVVTKIKIHSNINEDEFKKLIDALIEKNHIEHLNLCTDRFKQEAWAYLIQNVIQKGQPSSLREIIILDNNDRTDEFLNILISALKENTTIQRFSFRSEMVSLTLLEVLDAVMQGKQKPMQDKQNKKVLEQPKQSAGKPPPGLEPASAAGGPILHRYQSQGRQGRQDMRGQGARERKREIRADM